MKPGLLTRRHAIATGVAALATPGILRAEPEYPPTDTGPLWRQTATGMLTRQMEQEAQGLATPLAVLFASTDA